MLPIGIGGNTLPGYNLESSLRFRQTGTTHLERTPSVASNRKTWTWSGWVKRGIYNTQIIWGARTDANASSTPWTLLYFTSAHVLVAHDHGTPAIKTTTRLFRDSSAWYHSVWAVDTTQATGSNRNRIYVNGVEETSFTASTDFTLNYDTAVNSTTVHRLGTQLSGTNQNFDGYMTEVNFVDGQQLTPSDFGEYDGTTGVWKPKKYTGTYGTNGFYLPFTGEITPTVTAGFGGTAENVLYDDTNYLISNTTTGSGFDLVEYDFGESINMIDYNIQDLKFTGGTSTFRIYTSDVGGSMSNYTERVSLSVSSSFQNYTGNLGVTARYVKIRATNFGTNGQAHLNYFNVDVDSSVFSDNSGNANNWTPNNINLITDVMNDVPTLTDEDTANFPILNINLRDFTYLGLINASLQTVAGGVNVWQTAAATMAVPTSGKYYWEGKLEALSGSNPYAMFGILPTYYSTVGTYAGGTTLPNGFSYYLQNGYIYNNGTNAVYGSTATVGDVIGVAVDADNGKVWFSKNGTWQNSGDPTNGNDTNDATSVTGQTYDTTKEYYPTVSNYNGSEASINFGQTPFKYTPPTGYKKLNTYNLPDSTIADGSQYMNTVLYTGNGDLTSHPITGVGFSPDWIWIKRRDGANSHQTYDSVRTLGYVLSTDKTNAEADETSKFVSIDSDGFTIKSNAGSHNLLNATYVAWNWRGSDSTAVSNTDGSITSTVSANTDSGFSIVSYTGTGANATVGHGLSSAPSMYVVKTRDTAGDEWCVYHKDLTDASYYLYLNSTNAQAVAANFWNSTAPTSSVFNLGSNGRTNRSGDNFIAYCFAEVEGFSKFGSYTGNGSADGAFIYTGFRPAFVMVKQYTTTGNWIINDSGRAPYNLIPSALYPNLSNAEDSSHTMDLLSNGFKLRSTGDDSNGSGTGIIYMAFAENPFKQSLAR